MRSFSKPTRFERILSHVVPSVALKSFLNRQRFEMFAYEGGQNTRRRNVASTTQPSEASAYQWDRYKMMVECRELAENVGFVESILLKFATYVCGTLTYYPNTGDPALDKLIKDYLALWFKVCDVTGRHNFVELAQLALISMLRDGDIGFEWVKRDNFYGGLAQVEADRIGRLYESTAIPTYVGGITLDAWGKPSFYRVYERDPNGTYGNYRDVPAAMFIHLFDPRRVDQYRGITAFHAALSTLRDIHEIIEYEKMANKFYASQTAIITTESGEADDGYDYDQTKTDANDNTMNLRTVEGGEIRVFSTNGGGIKAFEHNRPSPAFQGLLTLLYREVALALNLPYGFVYDMSNLGGNPARLESAQAQRTFARMQAVLVNKFADRAKNLALMDGIARGDIPDNPNFMLGRWRGPAHPTADIGHESKAWIDEIHAGIATKEDSYAEEGKELADAQEEIYREAQDTIRRAKQLSTEEGVPMEMALNLLEMRGPNGAQPPAATPAPANGAPAT